MTITKSGELASFYTVNKTPIKHLRVYFSPKQAGEGDPSPENIRPIEGWNGVEVHKCGKNLFNPETVTMNMEIGADGKPLPTGSSNRWCITDFMPVKPNTTYIAKALLTAGSGRSAVYDANKEKISTKMEVLGADAETVISTRSTGRYVRLTVRIADGLNTIFEEASSAAAYEPYCGHTYNLNWSNDIGTVYGGYVDLITGEVCQEWYNVDPSQWIKYKESNEYYAYRLGGAPSAEKYSPTAGIQKISNMISEYGSFNSSNMNKNIIQYPNYITLQQDIDIMNLQYIYKLAEPIIHQLSPIQLSTLIGRNNIWSNADRVEIEYDLAESNDILYRRRNVLEKQYPHIITPAANGLINFNTDMIAPLKECKVYFNSIQEGEGDPSPENVRPISGWTGINVTISPTQQATESQILALDWSNSAGTIYGGYVDLVKGEVVQIWKELDLSTTEWSYVASTNRFETQYLRDADRTRGLITTISDMYLSVVNQTGSSFNKDIGDMTMCFNTSAGYPYIVLHDSRFTSAEELIDSFSSHQMFYKLAEPIHYSIDPITLKTLRGINNIWSNSNGNIELSYWTH